MTKDLDKICQLFASDSENVAIALQVLKGNPQLKEQVFTYYQPVLKASNKKTIKSVPLILKKLKAGDGTMKARLQIGTVPEIHSSITQLFLNGLELKTLPDWIRKLSNLKLLALSGCQLNKLPHWIGELSNLEFLSIAGNNVKKLPNSFGNLKSLKTCYLIDNKIQTLPSSVQNLTQLYSLYIKKGNLISHIELNRIKKLLPNIGIH